MSATAEQLFFCGDADSVRHLTPVDLSPRLAKDNIHCQTPLKNPHLTYFALTNARWQLLLRIEIG